MSQRHTLRPIKNSKGSGLIGLKEIKTSKEIIVKAEKSPNLYKVPVKLYQKLLLNEVTKKYKISCKNSVVEVNQESLYLVEIHEPGLETRVEVFSQNEAFITIKDHKKGFPWKLEVHKVN